MNWIIVLIAGAIVAALGRDRVPLFLLGAFSAWMVMRHELTRSSLRRLESQLENLSLQLRELQHKSPPAREQDVQTPDRDAARDVEISTQRVLSPSSTESTPTPEPARAARDRNTDRPAENNPPRNTDRHADGSAPAAPRSSAPSSPQGFEWRRNVLVRWALSGNIPVKIGILVSFFGVAFLLKLAVDEGWMRLPIELRLMGVAAFGVALLALGWRWRHRNRVYALSIQGGGVGMLYLTAFAALRLFDVLPAGAAFIIFVALAIAAGWLAVHQSARQLAFLAAVGGFLAPILASTGTGSHVALFGYYLVLNAGIAGVAFYRHWRELNLLGFVFTFGIGLVWGAQYYQEQYFASVEPFLVAHFLLYTAVAVLSALRQPFRFKGYVDSALVFGLPLVAFPLQAGLVDGLRPLAWSATVLCAFYAALAYVLFRQWGTTLRLLGQVYVALAVVFGTLAVPLWLDAPWVANTWALEAAAMIVIGLRQRQSLTHWGGVILLGLSALVYVGSFGDLGHATPLLNERFLGGFVLVAAITACARIYTVYPDAGGEIPLRQASAVMAWAGWLLLGNIEIWEHASSTAWRLNISLAYTAAALVALERLAARWVPAARDLAISVVPICALFWFGWMIAFEHPLARWGIVGWVNAVAAIVLIVNALPAYRSHLLTGAVWLAAMWVASELGWQADAISSHADDWRYAGWIGGFLGIGVLAWRELPRHYEAFDQQVAIAPILGLSLAATVIWNVESGADFGIPYLPVLNVLGALSVAAFLAAFRFAEPHFERKDLLRVAAGLGLLLVTFEVARSVHHYAGVRYAAVPMWRSGIFQAALSIVWSAIGIAGMVHGAKHAMRYVWIAGAGVMGVVVLKLFLVDLGNTGSITRIVSFIGVGLLLLVVGYLAPAPSSASTKADAVVD